MKFFLILLLVFTSAYAQQDPTTPPGIQRSAQEEVSSTGELKLNAIFNFPGNDSAIINGKAVHIGESIGSVKVLTISTETVTVKDEDGNTTTLHLFESLT